MSSPTERRRHATAESQLLQGRLTGLAGELLGRRFLVSGSLTVGRGTGNDVVLADPESSRAHAKITQASAGTFEVEDLGSRNGTLVNGVRIARRAALRFGDRLRVGATTFLFSRHDELGEELFQKNRLETVGRLTLALAHDLNNALCVVQSTSALLIGDGELGEPERREALSDVVDASLRAGAMAKRLMSFARGHDERAGEIDLSSTLAEALRLLRRTLPLDVTLEEELEPGLTVFAEPAQLQQVVFNLVLNARDAIASREGPGRIAVRTVLRDSEVVLTVADDGCGISESVKPRIFEPFFSSKQKGKGYGIGLSTVAEIVTNHGGTIDVESAQGRGSTFTVRFRAVTTHTARNTQRRAPTPQPQIPRVRGLHTLVLDPDRGVRNTIRRTLVQAGFEVDVVADASAAIATASAHRHLDLVIVDISESLRGTMDLFEHLRRVSPRVCVLCLTATGSETEVALSRSLGAHVLVVKPFTRDELLGAAYQAVRPAADEETTLGLRPSD